MFGRWLDPQGALSIMSALEREMDHLPAGAVGRHGVTASVRDEGEALVLRADLPGLGEQDFALSLEGEVLSLRGERGQHTPEGFRLLRSERPALRFAQSWTLPCRVDGDATTAALKDGVLTVTLPKAKEARPRRITVGTPS